MLDDSLLILGQNTELALNIDRLINGRVYWFSQISQIVNNVS